jgi:hypothetical protein
MSDDPGAAIVFLVLMVLAGVFGTGLYIGSSDATRNVQNAAIEHNAAEWRIDPKTSEKSFVWLTDEKVEGAVDGK